MVADRASATLDRITQLRISGLRVIKNLTLDLHGLTVLIGDNGTGKSSILEALELLRMARTQASFEQDVLESKHGGVRSLLRHGSSALRLGCRASVSDQLVDWDIEIRLQGNHPFVSTMAAYLDDPQVSLARSPHTETDDPNLQLRYNDLLLKLEAIEREGSHSTSARLTLLADIRELRNRIIHGGVTDPYPSDKRSITSTLAGIEVHVPFETRPLWQQRELDLRVGPRWPSQVEPTKTLSRYAVNLANAFQEVRNRGAEVWQRVVERARLGIREDLRDFRISPYGRGQVELEVVFGSAPDKPMPVEYLSEGQLAYLAMVALCELSDQSSVLAFDEPEVHLHPGLLARVVFMLEELSKTVPVILSTHSDRLLDCLSDPAASVVLCDLDEEGATRLRRPNKEALDKWLEDYRGVGSLRAEGYTEQLFDEPEAEEQDSAP
jgi:predicted ATPase